MMLYKSESWEGNRNHCYLHAEIAVTSGYYDPAIENPGLFYWEAHWPVFSVHWHYH